jgi:hypothetical protein
MKARIVMAKIMLGTFLALGFGCAPLLAEGGAILNKLKAVTTLSTTVPMNGDINPYGLVRIPRTVGNLTEGNYLVSNFNDAGNAQGTGTTIVEISPGGAMSQFAQISVNPGSCPGGVGLTTALAVLKTGWVIVGSLPTTDGTAATAGAGCLIVLDSEGNVAETFYGSLINGPWDMVWSDNDDQAVLFVTNVLNGTVAAGGSVVNQGTVVRVNLAVSTNQMPYLESLTVVGSGFSERSDPVALVIGPTGVGLSCRHDEGSCDNDADDNDAHLYIADSLNNRIAEINYPFTRTLSAGTGRTLTSGGFLNDPLGLNVAPDGHIFVVNGNDGNVIEISPEGKQLAKELIDSSGNPPGSGALFGVLFDPAHGLVFVDDATNTLNLLH